MSELFYLIILLMHHLLSILRITILHCEYLLCLMFPIRLHLLCTIVIYIIVLQSSYYFWVHLFKILWQLAKLFSMNLKIKKIANNIIEFKLFIGTYGGSDSRFSMQETDRKSGMFPSI